MFKNNLSESTTEQLIARKKTLRMLAILVAVVILTYAGYFIFKLVSGTWEVNNPLGVVGIGMLVVANSVISMQSAKVEKEIKSRRESQES